MAGKLVKCTKWNEEGGEITENSPFYLIF